MPSLINLDANATTPPLPEVIETVVRCLRDVPGNPGSRHLLGRKARQVLETSRESLAEILGAEPDEIVFTSGGTEANNLAMTGLARGTGRTILLSPGEHPSTLETCRHLANRGWSLHMLPVDADGLIGESAVANIDWSSVGLAAVILAHNETGVIQDIGPLARFCRERSIPLHLDGVQAVGKIGIDFHQLGATSLSLGAHKFHGPRGIGALLVRRHVKLAPLLFGGHQEHARRPGTEPVALIAGMAKALELWRRDQQQRTRHLTMLRDRLQSLLLESSAPVVVHAANAPRLPNTLNIAFPGVDGEALLVGLDLEGVCCSLGTTCASGSMEPAPMLLAMGLPPEIAKTSVRFSVSALNTITEIDEAAKRIAAIVSRLRKN
jgi:cysteine desulfurase